MIPDFQTIMFPLLKLLEDNTSRRRSELTSGLAKIFSLTEEELSFRVKSGSLQFDNRVQWAASYLKKAGFLNYPQRGIVQITPRGIEQISKAPGRITVNYLKQFDGLQEQSKVKVNVSMKCKSDSGLEYKAGDMGYEQCIKNSSKNGSQNVDKKSQNNSTMEVTF